MARKTKPFSKLQLKRTATNTPRWLLVGIELFVAVTAAVSGVALVRTNGLGAPVSLLDRSPFHSYIIPGIILTVVVGGNHAAAAWFTAVRHRYGLAASAIAAFGMLIWIFTQMYMIRQSHWLQILYFSGAILMLLLVLLLQRAGEFKTIQQ